MPPEDPIPSPYIPSWRNIKVFALGLVWVCLLSSGPAAYELWDAKNYDAVDWVHIRSVVGLCIGPAAVAYWRKYAALVTPPPNN